VLLDGLEALRSHLDNVILVGAQAVYVHAGEADLAVAPFTTDGDLALDSRTLAGEPLIEQAMTSAGFVPSDQPGAWIGRHNVEVDLLVPEAIAGEGTRGARIPPHSNRAARKVRGLEAALVDNATHDLVALDPGDSRRFSIRVAGPAALMVSKLVKLSDRLRQPRRLDAKDAYDIYRLLQAVETEPLAVRLSELRADAFAGETTMQALGVFEEHFAARDTAGTRLVVEHAGPLADADFIAESCFRLSRRLLTAMGEQS
jgi:hypothetical protein